MCHVRNVERLREILENRADSAESELFVTREVADALHSTPKVIRWLAYCRHIPAILEHFVARRLQRTPISAERQ